MDDSAGRIDALEIKAAYLEDTVDRLNDVVIRLSQDLKVLRAEYRLFRENLDEKGPDLREIEPPPHY